MFAQQTNWKTFNIDNTGYPYAVPNDILLNADANIWLGGTFGLTEFDGVHWLNQNQSNSDIPLYGINFIYEQNGKIYCPGYNTVERNRHSGSTKSSTPKAYRFDKLIE